MPLMYEEVKLNVGYRVDLMVENNVTIEIKCVDCFISLHSAQPLTYLKLSGCKVGYSSTSKPPV